MQVCRYPYLAVALYTYMKHPYYVNLFPSIFYDDFIGALECIEDKDTVEKTIENLPIVIISED